MVQSELASEGVDFTGINDVNNGSTGSSIRREPSFSRWCDDNGTVHLEQQLGNGDVSLEEDSDFELPSPQKNELQSRPLNRERLFNLKFQQRRSMQMNFSGTMDEDSSYQSGNGSEKYVPFDIENKSERGTAGLDSSVPMGGNGSLGKGSQNPVSVANILKTLFFILVWYTFSLFLTL